MANPCRRWVLVSWSVCHVMVNSSSIETCQLALACQGQVRQRKTLRRSSSKLLSMISWLLIDLIKFTWVSSPTLSSFKNYYKSLWVKLVVPMLCRRFWTPQLTSCMGFHYKPWWTLPSVLRSVWPLQSVYGPKSGRNSKFYYEWFLLWWRFCCLKLAYKHLARRYVKCWGN